MSASVLRMQGLFRKAAGKDATESEQQMELYDNPRESSDSGHGMPVKEGGVRRGNFCRTDALEVGGFYRPSSFLGFVFFLPFFAFAITFFSLTEKQAQKTGAKKTGVTSDHP